VSKYPCSGTLPIVPLSTTVSLWKSASFRTYLDTCRARGLSVLEHNLPDRTAS